YTACQQAGRRRQDPALGRPRLSADGRRPAGRLARGLERATQGRVGPSGAGRDTGSASHSPSARNIRDNSLAGRAVAFLRMVGLSVPTPQTPIPTRQSRAAARQSYAGHGKSGAALPAVAGAALPTVADAAALGPSDR